MPFLLYKAFRPVENGDEILIRRIGLLEESREAKRQHMIADTVILAIGDPPVKSRNGNVIAGDILPHETDRGTGGEIVPDPGQEAEGFPGKAGQDQVTNECAAEHDAIRTVFRRAGLAAHLGDGSGGIIEIVRGTGAETAGAGGKMLEVGQIDIKDTVEEAERVHCFITGCIPDEGDRRPPE